MINLLHAPLILRVVAYTRNAYGTWVIGGGGVQPYKITNISNYDRAFLKHMQLSGH